MPQIAGFPACFESKKEVNKYSSSDLMSPEMTILLLLFQDERSDGFINNETFEPRLEEM